MYAVIKSGGKQYRVAPGDIVRVEKIEVAPGDTVELDQVLMVSDDNGLQVGSPVLDGVKVTAEVVEQGRGEKIRVLKFRRRKHHRKQMGHRQYYTALRITGVSN